MIFKGYDGTTQPRLRIGKPSRARGPLSLFIKDAADILPDRVEAGGAGFEQDGWLTNPSLGSDASIDNDRAIREDTVRTYNLGKPCFDDGWTLPTPVFPDDAM
ncbi:hypothetical protein SCARD494_09893 [Seiridium cardinale]